MNAKERFILFAFVLAMVLGFSTFCTLTVRADEGAPSPTATPTATQPANDGSAVAQPTAAVTQVTEVSTPAPSAPAPARHKTASTADARAKTLSMPAPAKQGDPIWCPSGVAPKANTGGCTNTYTSFNYIDPANTGLVGSLSGKSTSGTVWIASGYDSSLEAGSPVSLDKGLLGTTANFALTMQGGWNGIPGSTTVSGSSTFGVPLSINWNANVILNNLEITGVSDPGSDALDVTTPKNITLNTINVHDNAGAGAVLDDTSGTGNVAVTSSQFKNSSNGDGLDVYSKGTISLTDSDAQGNSMIGAYLDNTYGTTAQNITLSGSNTFSENGADGLDVRSLGAITAKTLVGSSNGGWGAYLDNSTASTPQPVTISGSSNVFESNLGGLNIFSMGTITLNNLQASYNTGDFGQDPNTVYYASGAWLDNCLYNSGCTGSGNVILTGTNWFENNNRTGLYILSAGTITANNLNADGDGHASPTAGGMGAYLDNSFALSPKSLTLTGVNTFDFNNDGGLVVYSEGTITASNLNGNNDGVLGYYLDNTSGPNSSVTVSGTGTLDNNGLSGLNIFSNGAITLNSLDAENNSSYGAYIDNHTAATAQPVTLTGTNIFNWNARDGLFVLSHGNVSLNNLDAENNGGLQQDPSSGTPPYAGYGVYIVNDDPAHPSFHSNVTLTGTNTFAWNWFGGLAVNSYGTITTSNINANNNGQGHYSTVPAGSNGLGGVADWADGVYLDNCLIPGLTCTNTLAEAVSVNGTNNSFDNNDGSGLVVHSGGAITTNNLEASWNTVGWGLEFYNGYSGKTGGINLNGFINVFNNGVDGLSAYSNGPITTNNIDSSDNGSACPGTDCYGAHLDNSGSSSAAAVSVKGTNSLQNNTYDGLYVLSTGVITLNNVGSDSSSKGAGAYIDNSIGSTSPGVTLTGQGNNFNYNFTNGLDVVTHGAITLSNLDASSNTGNGSTLDNYSAPKPQPVTLISYADSAQNGGYGLYVHTKGAISVNDLYTEGNGSYGAKLDNSDAATPLAVTLTAYIDIYNNGSYGLYVHTKGAISINNLDADNNSGYGALLDNSGAATAQPVTLTGTSYFNGNSSGDGLDVNTKGAITISSIWSAGGNSGNGAVLNNTFGTIAENVTVTGNANGWGFSNNSGNGLEIISLGVITVNTLNSNWNNGYGAALDNHTATSPQAVVLGGSANTFNNNQGGDGLDIYSLGPVTTISLTANQNLGMGVTINNQYNIASPQNVTLNGTNTFNGDGATGLQVTSYGAITGNNLTANNSDWGVLLDNCGYDFGSTTCSSTLAKKITLTGTNSFNGNNQYGLWAASAGAVQANALRAVSNGAGGVYLNNQWGTASNGITLTGTNTFLSNGNFTNNTGDGLHLVTKGNITLNNIQADWNAGDGASLDTCVSTGTCQGSGTITLNGTNQFTKNNEDGLFFVSQNNITVNSVSADQNGGQGVNGTSNGGSITILGGNMMNNGSFGWNLWAETTATLKGVFAYGNNGGGFNNTNLMHGTLIIVRNYP